jgi:hypothetical protein
LKRILHRIDQTLSKLSEIMSTIVNFIVIGLAMYYMFLWITSGWDRQNLFMWLVCDIYVSIKIIEKGMS